MGKINYARVLTCGLIAGVVFNVLEMVVGGVLLGMDKQWTEAMISINRPMQQTPALMSFFLILYLVLGVAGMWLYAAIRPRYGAGAMTALRAGIALWFIGFALPQSVQIALHIYPRRLLATFLALALIECVAGILLGAKLYKEATQQQSKAVSA